MNEKNKNKNNDESIELESLLTSAEEKGRKIADLGRHLTHSGQEIADIAHATKNVIDIVHYPPNYEELVSDWNIFDRQADNLLQQVEKYEIPAFYSTSGTASFSSSGLAFEPDIYAMVPQSEYKYLLHAVTDLSSVLERSSDEKVVIDYMISLGLDQAKADTESPVTLFETAHNAYTKPVSDKNPIITSIIPVRESIRLTIDSLLKRRPQQEETKKEWNKIISIGTQLKYESIDNEQVESWAFKWTSHLKYSLSPSKEDVISRDEWRNRLIKATIFLKSFLSGIDPSKLK
jgi:hypothetical protein